MEFFPYVFLHLALLYGGTEVIQQSLMEKCVGKTPTIKKN
jgi:hypothetical protein